MDQLVHPILTEEQAGLVHQALIALLNTPEGDLSTDPGEEHMVKNKISELVYFFNEVVDHPEKFGLRSVEDTKRLIRAHKSMAKGPAQPRSRRNKRKARQEARQGGHKQRRKERKEMAAAQREAVRKVEADMREAEEAYQEAQRKYVERFETLAAKDVLSNEELQEVIEMFGSPEGAARVREIRALQNPQARLDAAADKAAAGATQ